MPYFKFFTIDDTVEANQCDSEKTSHINQMKTIRKSPIHKKYCIDSYMELRQTESIGLYLPSDKIIYHIKQLPLYIELFLTKKMQLHAKNHPEANSTQFKFKKRHLNF